MSYEFLTFAALAGSAIASFAAFQIAGRNLDRWPWLRAVGRKMYEQKMAMLEKPPLKQYHEAVKGQKFTFGLAIITFLILLKSFGCALLGLITVFYLPLGVGTIPPLAAQHGDRPGLRRWVASVTGWQLTSHLLAACIGFSATWLWISDDLSPLKSMAESPVLTVIFLAGSVVTGLVAAWIETTGHFRKGFL